MKYTEYLSSAKRHNHACSVLQEKIENYESEGVQGDNLKFLVTSLYYLSGYMIECSLKFKILEVFGFDSSAEVNVEQCNRIGLNYKRQIGIHNFDKLQDLLASKIPDITHESYDEIVTLLLLRWDPKVRYEDRDLECQEVKKFYNHANCFLKSM